MGLPTCPISGLPDFPAMLTAARSARGETCSSALLDWDTSDWRRPRSFAQHHHVAALHINTSRVKAVTDRRSPLANAVQVGTDLRECTARADIVANRWGVRATTSGNKVHTRDIHHSDRRLVLQVYPHAPPLVPITQATVIDSGEHRFYSSVRPAFTGDALPGKEANDGALVPQGSRRNCYRLGDATR